MIKPSFSTVFLICFDVAPTLASIPYCFVFSDTDILKLFLITNTLLTTIIPITIPPRLYNAVIVVSLKTPSNFNNEVFVSYDIF